MSRNVVFVTGAGGQLGGLVIDVLIARGGFGKLIGGIRRADEAAAAMSAKGVEPRVADYDRPGTLATAFEGVDRLLLVSSVAGPRRAGQHRAVIEAARRADVRSIVYTSMLRADVSPMALAEDHRTTEAALVESGVPFTLLRNGWYTENYDFWVRRAVSDGVVLGSAGEGRIATAARADYAEAAAVVLAGEGHDGRTYELAGDDSFDMPEFCATVGDVAGRRVEYRDLPREEFEKALLGMDVPEAGARMMAAIDLGVAAGALDDRSGQLGRLIGRPTTPYRRTIEATVAGRD